MSVGQVRMLAAAACFVAGFSAGGDSRAIDLGESTITVHVAKSGLFSAFADNHTIRARLSRGTIQDTPPASVEIAVRTADMRVLDTGLSPAKRAEVQTRMLGAEVLDAAQFGEITFASSRVDSEGEDRWRVTGQLAIHGQTRTVTLSVARRDGHYRGATVVRQRDFGIEPISIAGGTVKVKDELRVEFDIVAR
jgi:polyisoprenoid-binding protein YceI